MEENQNRFLPPEKIKANIGITLTKMYGNYQEAVLKLKNAYVGEDNIEEVQQLMRNVNSVLSTAEKMRKADKQPGLDYGREVDRVYEEFTSPIEIEKEVIQKKLNEVAKSKADKAEKLRQELMKQQQITEQINNFILDNSVKIASATTNEQLLSVERLINLEKGNKSRYDNQLPLLIERCNELTAKIKEQKELVKQKELLEIQKKEAEKSGDDKKLEELQEKEAEIDNKIQDNTVNVQENASSSLIVSDNSAIDDISSPKARRTTWKAEIQDASIAVKKAKDMLRIELEPEKVRQSINTLKAAGVFTGKDEVIVNGIRYYLSQTF